MLDLYNDRGDSLVLTVLRVLIQIASGTPRHERIKLTADDDFDMHISNDDLQDDGKLPEANYQTSETIQASISAIRLCARAVIMRLVTHLGHFPMGIGAARLSSMVEEQDDVNGFLSNPSSVHHNIYNNDNNQVYPINNYELRRDSVELPSILYAQNVQLFMLNSGLVASFIELPLLKLPGGGVTAGLITAEKQVRVLLRDLNGKACWDASILYSEPKSFQSTINCYKSHFKDSIISTPWQLNNGGNSYQIQDAAQSMDSFIMHSTREIETLPIKHTLRHRPLGELPLAKDIASDLDQLDDVSFNIFLTFI